jgi:protein-S-isoprenylcysteine O-methyltransferase Ste14
MYRLGIFILVNVGIIYVSWKPLHNPHSHGFYRFFAFEMLVLLFLLNIAQWFKDPFSELQIISWAFLLLSLILVVHGVYLLQVVGRPRESLEDTTCLVEVGAYRYIRHPLYASLLLLGIGIFFKDISPVSSSLLLGLLAFLFATARLEEAENLAHFGPQYGEYIQRTKMFVPFLI